jgi:protein TonB
MHATLDLMTGGQDAQATYRASFPPVEDNGAPAPAPSIASPQRYDGRSTPNWAAISAIVAFHVIGLVALVKLDVINVIHTKKSPLMVDLVIEKPAPPPTAPPEKVEPVKKVQPDIVAPPPIITVNTAPPPVATAPAPPPPKATVVAQAAPTSPPGPVSVDDFDSSMIKIDPPRFPMESRKRREQGTVILDVTVGIDGLVSQIRVATSSGFERLDKAALNAVRNWQWKPLIRGGQPVSVRGAITIPFVLKG